MSRRRALLAPYALIVALGAALAAGNVAAEGIGVVDMERVLQESSLGRAAQARLQERFADRQRPFAEEEVAIKRMQQTLERDRPLMSKTQVEKTEAEIKTRIARFEGDVAGIQKEIMEAQQTEGRKIVEPARKAVDAVAKQKKLSLVFEKNQAPQAGVMYLDASADITDAVIAEIDARGP